MVLGAVHPEREQPGLLRAVMQGQGSTQARATAAAIQLRVVRLRARQRAPEPPLLLKVVQGVRLLAPQTTTADVAFLRELRR